MDDTGAVVRRAADTVRLLYDVAATIEESKERERLVRHALSYEAKKKLDATIAPAESQLDIVVLPDHLDRNKWLLNVDNGTLDLQTGEQREHRREDLITKGAGPAHEIAYRGRLAREGRSGLVALSLPTATGKNCKSDELH